MEKDWIPGHRAGQQVGLARRFRRMGKPIPLKKENKDGIMVPSLTAGAFGGVNNRRL